MMRRPMWLFHILRVLSGTGNDLVALICDILVELGELFDFDSKISFLLGFSTVIFIIIQIDFVLVNFLV